MHSSSEAQLSKALGKLSKTSIKIPTNKTAGRGLLPSYPLLLLHRIQVIHLRRATFEFVYFSMLFLFACLFLTHVPEVRQKCSFCIFLKDFWEVLRQSQWLAGQLLKFIPSPHSSHRMGEAGKGGFDASVLREHCAQSARGTLF